MTLDDITIVLCRPSESGNVGAVCRAMKNMGLRHLCVIAPERPLDDATIAARAVHAEELWSEAAHFDTLEAALAGHDLSVGTTRRTGQKRKRFNMSARELAGYLAGRAGSVAVVFGNERTGLTEAELNLCTMAAHVPVSDAFPSLNLSHAVQVFCYELRLALHAQPGASWQPAPLPRVQALAETITTALSSIGFYKQASPEQQQRFFRELFSRAAIVESEAKYLESLFRKIGHLSKIQTEREEQFE